MDWIVDAPEIQVINNITPCSDKVFPVASWCGTCHYVGVYAVVTQYSKVPSELHTAMRRILNLWGLGPVRCCTLNSTPKPSPRLVGCSRLTVGGGGLQIMPSWDDAGARGKCIL